MLFGTLAQNYLFGSLPSALQLWIGQSPLMVWAMIALLRLPHALALGCLFWAAFGDVPPTEADDDEPPVFRYDDGSEALPR